MQVHNTERGGRKRMWTKLKKAHADLLQEQMIDKKSVHMDWNKS